MIWFIITVVVYVIMGWLVVASLNSWARHNGGVDLGLWMSVFSNLIWPIFIPIGILAGIVIGMEWLLLKANFTNFLKRMYNVE